MSNSGLFCINFLNDVLIALKCTLNDEWEKIMKRNSKWAFKIELMCHWNVWIFLYASWNRHVCSSYLNIRTPKISFHNKFQKPINPTFNVIDWLQFSTKISKVIGKTHFTQMLNIIEKILKFPVSISSSCSACQIIVKLNPYLKGTTIFSRI